MSRYAVCLALAAAAASASACSDSSHSTVIVRIGDTGITTTSLVHWITVLRGGSTSPMTTAGGQALRTQALELLISYQWLAGEAASRKVAVSGSEVSRQVDRLEQMQFANGTAELREFLKSTGETVNDIELQARAELIEARLRQIAVDSAAPVTAKQVAAYYIQHKQSFLLLGRRLARFVNRGGEVGKTIVERIKREAEAGKSITQPQQRRHGEIFAGARVPPYPGNEYEAAIDASKPNVISGPYHIGYDYWLYQVVKVIPARQQTLSEVASSIRRQLTSERRQQALTAFIDSRTAAWTAKTDCTPGYVVPRCKQYPGRPAEDPFSLQ